MLYENMLYGVTMLRLIDVSQSIALRQGISEMCRMAFVIIMVADSWGQIGTRPSANIDDDLAVTIVYYEWCIHNHIL